MDRGARLPSFRAICRWQFFTFWRSTELSDGDTIDFTCSNTSFHEQDGVTIPVLTVEEVNATERLDQEALAKSYDASSDIHRSFLAYSSEQFQSTATTCKLIAPIEHTYIT